MTKIEMRRWSEDDADYFDEAVPASSIKVVDVVSPSWHTSTFVLASSLSTSSVTSSSLSTFSSPSSLSPASPSSPLKSYYVKRGQLQPRKSYVIVIVVSRRATSAPRDWGSKHSPLGSRTQLKSSCLCRWRQWQWRRCYIKRVLILKIWSPRKG